MVHGKAPGITAPGIVLGVGLGGFVDGIVLHQILQWHHMLTSQGDYPDTTVRGLEVNTLWDGLFHAATWVFVAVGLGLLWRALSANGRGWGWRSPVGLMLAGWGLFNLVEGVINHQLLGIHHVRAGPHQTLYDVGFLALGVVLVLVGWALHRSDAALERALT